MPFVVILTFIVGIAVPNTFALEENGVIEMPFTDNPPSIDGKWTTETEWEDASVTNMVGEEHEVILLVKHDRDYIYFMFDAITDQTRHVEDQANYHVAYLMFDTNNDGGNFRQIDDIRFVYGDIIDSKGKMADFGTKALNMVTVGDPGGTDEHNGRQVNEPKNFRYSNSMSSENSAYESGRDHYIHEFRIPISFLHPSDSYGFAAIYDAGVSTKDFNDREVINWPTTLQKSSIPSQFGNLISPENTVTIPPVPVLSISTSELSFGNVEVSEKSLPKGVTISNKGTGLLKISSVRASSEFSILNIDVPAVLRPGENISFDAVFVPIYEGEKFGSITVTSNDLSKKTFTITAKGEGVEQGSNTLGGGCLIATATYGTELAPQVQQLRELRDNTLLQTNSGTSFMSMFNSFYYSFSPTVANLERENFLIKETVRLTITPLLASLSLLNNVNIDSEEEMLGYGIGIILLNVGMYFGLPVFAIIKLKNFVSFDFRKSFFYLFLQNK